MVGPADDSQPKATQTRNQRSSQRQSDRDTHMTSTAQRRKRKRSTRRNSAALHRSARNSGISAQQRHTSGNRHIAQTQSDHASDPQHIADPLQIRGGQSVAAKHSIPNPKGEGRDTVLAEMHEVLTGPARRHPGQHGSIRTPAHPDSPTQAEVDGRLRRLPAAVVSFDSCDFHRRSFHSGSVVPSS